MPGHKKKNCSAVSKFREFTPSFVEYTPTFLSAMYVHTYVLTYVHLYIHIIFAGADATYHSTRPFHSHSPRRLLIFHSDTLTFNGR